MTLPHNEGSIAFTTKEMLLKLDEKIDRIERKLDSKVDVAAFERIQARVEQAADRALVVGLEMKLNTLVQQVELQDKVQAALNRKSREVEAKSASNFTKGEKIVGALLALIALGIQAYVVFGGVS